ncbi:MAG: MFS transporter [Acidimicrobiales bacterium]
MPKRTPATHGAALLIPLGAVLATTMLMRASQNMALTTYPLVGGDLLHLHGSVIGALGAGTGAVTVVTMVALTARVRPHYAPYVLVGAMVVMAVAFPVVAEADNASELAAAVVLLGFSGALVLPTLITAAGANAHEGQGPGARDRPIALVGVALSASLALGPFIETGVLDLNGGNLRDAFLWFTLGPLAAASVVATVAVLHRRRARASSAGPAGGHALDSPGEPVDVEPVPADPVTGEVAAVGPAGSPLDDEPAAVQAKRVTLAASLKDPAFRVSMMGQLVYAAPFAALVVFGALLARHAYGLSPAMTQVAFGTFFAGSFLVRVWLAWRSPVPHKLALFRLATLLTFAGMALLAVGHGIATLLIAMVVLGVPHGLTFSLAMAFVAEDRHREELASLNAHLSAIVQAVNVALPLLLGWGIDGLGYRPVFALVLLPVLAAGVLQHLAIRQFTARHGRLVPAGAFAAGQRLQVQSHTAGAGRTGGHRSARHYGGGRE